jgi:hypothetical protein
MVYKITLGGGLLRAQAMMPAIQTLSVWHSEGKIELFEADRARETKPAFGWPGAPRTVTPTRTKRNRAMPKSKDGTVSFARIAAVVFPRRDPNRLGLTEINDVAHLLQHHLQGHSIFVTNKVQELLSDGRREKLAAAFRIEVMTPEETVELLGEKHGWSPVLAALAQASGLRR